MAFLPQLGGKTLSRDESNGTIKFVGPYKPAAYQAAQQAVNRGYIPAPYNLETQAAARKIIEANTPGQTSQSTGQSGAAVAGGVDPAAAQAAADAAKASQLRGEITSIINNIKDIFDSRYGAVKNAAKEQVGKLEKRFGQESQDVTDQVATENATAGASFAGRGTRDSSDYGNTVDTITQGGEKQIRDLGTELSENKGKIGSYVASKKASFDAQKGGLDTVLSRLAESTDPDELTSIRNTLDSRIAELRAGSADDNTEAQNISALQAVAPASSRGIQLQTTLAKIVGSGSEPKMKSAIGMALISNSGLSDAEKQKLEQAFQSDLSTTDEKQQQQ